MSTPIVVRGKQYYLGDEELFVRVTEVGYDDEIDVVYYEIRTVWVDETGAWQECRSLNVCPTWQPKKAACLAGFTTELQPAQLVYRTDPDHGTVNTAIATLIGGDEIRFLIFN